MLVMIFIFLTTFPFMQAERASYIEEVVPTRPSSGDCMTPTQIVELIHAEIDAANELDYETDKVGS